MTRLFFIFSLAVVLISCNDFEPHGNPFTPNIIEAEQILDNYSVTTIEFGADAEAWVGTTNSGVIRYTPSGTQIFNATNSPIPASTPIYDIAYDMTGNTWIATEGLIKYDGTTFTKYTSENSPIPVNSIKSIAVDQNNNVWFTAGNADKGGLVKFDGATFTVYTPENSELPVNFVKNVYVDGGNNVWVSSNEVLNESFVTKISGTEWHTFNNSDFGFVPPGIGQIAVNASEEIFAIIDYTLAPSLGLRGSKLFSFLPETTDKARFDLKSLLNAITIDSGGKLWYVAQHEFGIYDGVAWIIESPDFTNANLVTVIDGPQDTMWFGTSDGVYIMERSEVLSQ